MSGTRFVPAFWTTICIDESFARFCLLGKVALTTRNGKMPLGSALSCGSPLTT